jgi:dienelactone hydrolase
MKGILLICLWLMLAISAAAEIVTKEITYIYDSTTFKGYAAYDASLKGKRPGILVAHEWWGLNDFTKSKAKELASMGYFAFALDMYGDGETASDMKTAAKMAGELRGTPRMRERAVAGYDEMLKQDMVDPQRTAAIGFCFGGACVLELAYSGAGVNGVVTFHGGLVSPQPEDLGKIKAKFLILHGADDPNIPRESIEQLQNLFRKEKVDWQFIYFGNTVHSFTNPAAGTDNGKGAAYNAESAGRAWDYMKLFLSSVLKNQ